MALICSKVWTEKFYPMSLRTFGEAEGPCTQLKALLMCLAVACAGIDHAGGSAGAGGGPRPSAHQLASFGDRGFIVPAPGIVGLKGTLYQVCYRQGTPTVSDPQSQLCARQHSTA